MPAPPPLHPRPLPPTVPPLPPVAPPLPPPPQPLPPAAPPLLLILPHLPRPPCAPAVRLVPTCVPPLPAGRKNGRTLLNFTFLPEHKLTLLQCVSEHDAHRVGHGQLDKLFKKVRDTCIENMAPSVWDSHVKPTVKTLRDKFPAMTRERRVNDRENTAASDIVEDITETYQLLDDLIH